MVSLHEINENGVKHFYFDGVICYAGRQRYVQKVPFEILSIGGYEEPERSSVGPYIWIQSIQGAKRCVWYRLGHPADEYKRYHKPFLWIADLAKHLVDYLHVHTGIDLSDLRYRFHDWLQSLYPNHKCIRRWLDQYGDRDFRRIVAAHANFLYCQAIQVDGKHEKHPIWEEIHPRILCSIPEQLEPTTYKDMYINLTETGVPVSTRKTTVTPYVFDCFKRLPWKKFLYCQSPSSSVIQNSQRYSTTWHLRDSPTKQKLEVRIPLYRRSSDVLTRGGPKTISIGDVVAIPKDNKSAWKTDDEEYLGYVQSLLDTDNGQELGLLWFYRPADTTCLKMFYPHPRELFLSDHCNCHDAPVFASEVIRKPKVAYAGPEDVFTEFFCRQQYVEGDGAWVTLQDSHFRCVCRNTLERPRYSVGDTLLVSSTSRMSSQDLEPVVLLEQDLDGLEGHMKVVRLLRKGRDYGDPNAAANELVLTDRSDIIPMACVERPCQVRFYSEAEKKERRIPSPYDRQGASDFFYITTQDQAISGAGLENLQKPWPSFIKQGWEPTPTSTPPQRKLRGLDLFCGGGNLARGLEEGGAVRFISAVDWSNQAIHTYKANMPIQSHTKLFRGSVNYYLSQALEGKGADLVAQFGEIEMICAGHPCPGFSLANPRKGNERGLLHESMVASVLAFIDFYRPKYALMENVKGMAVGDDRHNVLAQVVCCLVGMGYQVQTSCLDAWSFGCPQSRSRVIITIAAPGLTPLPEPAPTHSHPDEVCGGSLGKTANGLHIGSRTMSRTPFKYVTSAEATKDLPTTDARTTCISFPDHRMSRTLAITDWVRVSSVPRFPSGCSFVKACKRGYMPQTQIDRFSWDNKIRSRHDSRSWQRVSRNSLMPTIMTEPRPHDGAGGQCLHWDDNRLLTIMEARRGQGIPDYEVLIGSPSDQWKLVGNSVARPKALALGISLRTAWLANTSRQRTLSNQFDPALENFISMIDESREVKRPAVAACGDPACNGWPAQNMTIKLTALTSKAPSLAMSVMVRQPSIEVGNQVVRNPESQPSKNLDSVKAYQTEFRQLSVGHNGTDGTSRWKPQPLQHGEILSTSTTTAQSEGYDAAALQGFYCKG